MTAVSPRKGGNILGLADNQENAIIMTAGAAVLSDEAALAVAMAELQMTAAQMKEMSKSMNGDMDFIYINYADASQDPIGSYGPDNVQYMRDIATSYDPDGVFQSRIPGGFKVSRVV
jgi:hypothetical protein